MVTLRIYICSYHVSFTWAIFSYAFKDTQIKSLKRVEIFERVDMLYMITFIHTHFPYFHNSFSDIKYCCKHVFTTFCLEINESRSHPTFLKLSATTSGLKKTTYENEHNICSTIKNDGWKNVGDENSNRHIILHHLYQVVYYMNKINPRIFTMHINVIS